MSLACPVRGCGEALRRGEGRFLACPRGHRFDLARSGYCNLLQPQDKRSRHPGDSAVAVAARRRLFDAGHGDWLLPHLRHALDRLRLLPARRAGTIPAAGAAPAVRGTAVADGTAASGSITAGAIAAPGDLGLRGTPAVPNIGGSPSATQTGASPAATGFRGLPAVRDIGGEPAVLDGYSAAALDVGRSAAALVSRSAGAPGLGGAPTVLDVGCGEGFYLGTLARERGFAAHGLDLAADAVDLAARRYPAATWVVANADRFLPYTAGSIDLAISLTARINPPEMRRILRPATPAGSRPGGAGGAGGNGSDGGKPGEGAHGGDGGDGGDEGGDTRHASHAGHLLIAVPGPDDLVELRAAVLGAGELRDRLQPALAALAADFELVWQGSARTVLHLDAGALRDLLAATYRGARGSQREQAASLTARDVTMSRDLACLRPRRETR